MAATVCGGAFSEDPSLAMHADAAVGAGSGVTKDALMQNLANLPYAARVSAVSQWANSNRGVGAARLAAELTKDAPSDDPIDCEVDEDLSSLFPPQQTSVTSNFHEHQLGVFAAAASKDTAALVTAAKSASRMTKKLAVKESARLSTDAEIVAMICDPKTLPKDRQEFVQQCMRFRKHVVLGTVFSHLRALDGDDFAARCLHGLSSAAVEPALRELFENGKLLWPKLWRFHQTVLLKMLTEDLQATHPLTRIDVWRKWQPKFDASVRQQHHSVWRALLQLFVDFRPFKLAKTDREYVAAMTAESERGTLSELDKRVVLEVPSWVRGHALSATLRDPAAASPSAALLQVPPRCRRAL